MLVSGLDEADALICSTSAGKRVMEHLFQSLVEQRPEISPSVPVQLPVIPLGIDCRKYRNILRDEARARLGIAPETVVMLYFGRFSPINKCDLGPLILAFSRQFSRSDDASLLVLAGDDTQHQMAESMRRFGIATGCADKLWILPDCTQQKKSELFAAADIFVSPSDNLQETFGITLTEAMASGLPVIASDWNGYRELVIHNETGFLVPTYWPAFGDEIELTTVSASFDIRNALMASTTVVDFDVLMHYARVLVDNRDLRAEMGRKARVRAESTFDYKVIVPRWEGLWDDLVRRAGVLRKNMETSKRRDPLTYSVRKVFGHYPTRVIEDRSIVEVTATGTWWLESDISLNVLASLDDYFPRIALQAVVRLVVQLGRIEVGALIRELCKMGGTDLSARAVIARLLKSGVLRIVPASLDIPAA
jgi:glycosyltransferase involved in cell wall biosynthesis